MGKESKTMTNQEWLLTLPAEECYQKMYWLMYWYGNCFTQSSAGIIEWLRAEHTEEGAVNNGI